MTTLLLTLALLSADLSDLIADINAARVLNGALPVERDDRLDRAAELQVEWLSYAAKRNEFTLSDHHCSTDWLFVKHPELAWDRLFATFPDGIPDWLVAFDLARLCAYSNLSVDIGAYVKRQGDPVAGWLRSDGHRAILLGDWQAVGVASAGVGGGKFAVWATFGSDSQ